MANGARTLAVFGLAVSIFMAAPAWAQSRRGAGAPVSRPAGRGSSAEAGGPLVERAVNLSRNLIDTAAQQRTAGTAGSAARGGGGRFLQKMTNAVNGDEARQKAAQEILEAEASTEASRGRTVVVVIGGEADRDKVRTSLGTPLRQVTLLFVDTAVADERTDNGAIFGGLAGMAKGMATNLWIYLPSPGDAHRRRPNQVLSTEVASPTLWTGLFALDGDVPPQLPSAMNGQGFRSNPAGTPASPEPQARVGAGAPVTGAMAEGDVLSPKIAGVKILAQPSADAAVIAVLSKADEVVVIGGERNGYINVEGAAGRGWTNAKLFLKR
ncbi:MAG: hypothetical protein AB7I13_05205 [Vicinamibacterales bacterium]